MKNTAVAHLAIGAILHTAPLTAGGLSVLQALATLKAMNWQDSDPADPRSTHARVEALRLAWRDRLLLLGDPDATEIPVVRLLSEALAQESAARVRQAVEKKQLIAADSDGLPAGGTVHLTAVDKQGMMVAVTLTHGEGFGARVTVDSLGLVLGHGMSGFNPRPGHPNSPAWLAAAEQHVPRSSLQDRNRSWQWEPPGAAHYLNTMVDVLVKAIGAREPITTAAAAPRMHTEGSELLYLAEGWPASWMSTTISSRSAIRSNQGLAPT